MISSKIIIFISIFCILLFKFSVLAIEDEYQIQLKQEEQQNNDDTSLFREVENAIDEDSDEDAYRMLKSLQEVSESEDEDEEQYENNDNELYNNKKSMTDDNEKTEENDEIHEQEPMNEEDEFEEEDEDEDEDEDDELSPEFPEFQNEATTEFFENLPKQPIDSLDSKINSDQDTIDEEEEEGLDEEIEEPDQEDEEEETINKEIEIKEKEEKDQVQANHNIPNVPSFDDSIPWQRPDSARFYPDTRVKESAPPQQTGHSFKFWYLFLLSVVLTLLYRSITHRPNGVIDLSTVTSNNSSWNRDEKDYLPLHNSNKRNSYYKNEIKSS